MGSQALPGGLRDDQHIVCCGQQGEGEVPATLKTLGAGRPWRSAAAMWRRSRLAAGSEGHSGIFDENTHYRVHYTRTTSTK